MGIVNMSAALPPESRDGSKIDKNIYQGSTIKNVPSGPLLFS